MCYNIVLLIIIFSPQACGQDVTNQSYFKRSGKHIVLNYTDIDTLNILYLQTTLELNFSRISKDLKTSGISEHTRPINIFLYKDFGLFMKDMDIKDSSTWIMGESISADTIRMMSPNSRHMLIKRKETFDYGVKCIIHEMVHSINFLYNKELGEENCWLSEGVAMYESGQKNYIDLKVLKRYSSQLPKQLKDLDEGENFKDIYYIAYTYIEFIIKQWGFHRLVALLKHNGNIKSVMGISEMDFQKRWVTFVVSKYFYK